MDRSILEESAETRRVGAAQFGGYALELSVARPIYLFDKTEPPFYFHFFKDDEEDEESMEGLTPPDGVPVRDMRDFKKLVKRHGKRLGIPSAVFNSLRAKIELDDVGRGKDFDEPEQYFMRTETEKQKNDRELLDGAYEQLKKEMPGATFPQMNARLLYIIAAQNHLPRSTGRHMPDYSRLNRKLTMDEIRDDMENRSIMSRAFFV